MNIDPSLIGGAMLRQLPGAGTPAQSDVDAFAAAMTATARKPEQFALDAVSKLQSGDDDGVVQALLDGKLDAEGVAGLQRKLLEQRSETDVIAKVVGSFSQALNKLTSQQ